MNDKAAKPTHAEVFSTWGDWIDHVDQPPLTKGPHDRESLKAPRHDWDLSLGWEGALDLARQGWSGPNAEVSRFAEHVESNIDVDLFQTSFTSTFDVAGAEVDVDRYLQGEPECLIESTPLRISRQGRAVRVVITGGGTCNVQADNIRNRGAAIVALCDVLARCQHPVEVWVGWQIATHGSDHVLHAVKVQDANDALDVDRLLFAIAHPACHRRLAFRARERLPERLRNLVCSGGYGRTEAIDAKALPNPPENTIYLGPIDNERWTEDKAVKWIVEQLDTIFA